jgi:NADH-quinone oxidoreductase subunit H
MIAYEVAISLIVLPVILLSGTLNFTRIAAAQAITGYYILPLLPISIMFVISMIAETNRTPFDLPEAEAELVAGYNVEYSSISFAMFFLAEYSNMIMMSLLKTILFLGG